MVSRNDVLRYIVDEYFGGSTSRSAEITGYSVKQFDSWLSGDRQPNKQTIEYLIHSVFTPQFKVIVEFGELNTTDRVLTQMKSLLKGHEDRTGIYAFYDSMANLLYVGKATNLLDESYAAIRRDVHVSFPSGVKNKPECRYEIVRYFSAYDVGDSNWLDYPKHVESLILRISKPPLNKNIGSLEMAYVSPTES